MRPVASFPHLAEPSEASDHPGLDMLVQSFLLGRLWLLPFIELAQDS